MHMKPAENICDPGDGGDAVSAVETASNALTALVRLLARQAALEQYGLFQDEIEQRLTYDSLVGGSDG